MAHLHSLPFFARLDAPVLARLVSMASCRRYERGRVIILEGDALLGLYFLEFGWIKLTKVSTEGRELVLQVLGPDEVFNYMGVFGQRTSPVTAIALEPVGLWLLRHSSFHEALMANADIAMHIVEGMADWIEVLMQLAADLSLHTVEARLARYLLAEARDAVLDQHEWSTRAHLAAQLGTVPDVLSRALHNVVEQGLIRVERHQIQIVDAAGLASRAYVV